MSLGEKPVRDHVLIAAPEAHCWQVKLSTMCNRGEICMFTPYFCEMELAVTRTKMKHFCGGCLSISKDKYLSTPLLDGKICNDFNED